MVDIKKGKDVGKIVVVANVGVTVWTRRKNNMNKREMEIHFSTWFDIIPLFPDAKML